MTRELCDRCCRSINTFSKQIFLIPTDIANDGGKICNSKTVVLCTECARKFLKTQNEFLKGNTRERLDNIHELNILR